MKNKNSIALLAVLTFMLLVPRSSAAQEKTYVHLEYIKLPTNNWGGYWGEIQDVWKPLYKEMAAQGKLKSWKLFWVRFPAGTEIPYDIVNVTFHADSIGIANTKIQDFLTKNNDGASQALAKLQNLINHVKTETYEVVEEVTGNFELDSLATTNQNYQIDFMDAAKDKAYDYARMEAEIFKPMHQVAISDRRLKSWTLCKRLSQDNNAILQRFLIFNQWSSWANWQNGGSLADFQEVNPSLDQDGFNAIFSKIGNLRRMTKSEMWSIWDEL